MRFAPLIFTFALVAAAADNPHRPLAGTPWTRHTIDSAGRGADGTKLADSNGDGLPDVVTGWEEEGETRMYLNPGPARARQPWPKVTVGKTPAAEDAVWAGLDGDGALDVVTATEGGSANGFIHWAPPQRNQLLDAHAWRQDRIPAVAGLGGWLFVQPFQFDGRHGPDLLLGSRPNPKTPAPSIGWLEAPANPREMAAWKWHPLATAGWIMSIERVDMNHDGVPDILYSDRMGPTRGIYWFENPGPADVARGSKLIRHQLPTPGVHQVMFLTVGDVDGDGLQDVVAGVEMHALERDRPEAHSRILWLRRLDPSGRRWAEHSLRVPGNTGNVKGVAIGDVDADGRADLVVSCEHASEGRRGVYWLQQGATPGDADWTAFDLSGPDGIKFDLVHLLDLNGNGHLDVLTNEELEDGRGLGVIWYENPHRAKR